MQYTSVLNTLTINDNLQFKNKIYFAPMGVGLSNIKGEFTNELADFYNLIFQGGCGFAVTGNVTVSEKSKLSINNLSLYNKEQFISLCNFFDQINNQYKNLIFIQLHHYGSQGNPLITNNPLLSPSGIISQKSKDKGDQRFYPVVMSAQDIEDVIKAYIESAKMIYETGIKNIQIHAANGYLISSFLSPYTNLRSDKYGGNTIKRGTILLEILDGIHAATQGKMNISVRLGIHDLMGNQGQYPELLEDLVKILPNHGVSMITCSIATIDSYNKLLNYNQSTDQLLHKSVETIKTFTNIPVGFDGFINSLEKADQLIRENICDFVGMSRALFADNNLIKKTINKQYHSINKCLYDGNCFKDKSNPLLDRVYCCVNKNYLRPNHIHYR
ncbi:Dihydrolipoamide dehydrogenase (E3) component of pyruvate/2-oxoglutarate dehydrogenase complex or glutathione oxidoreductase (Lpd) (PDB:6QKG) [Commensalibacter communis]|uniref:oxidoreductase n=1 Tax=Commensalibacter communis TaxID=2972786 RepID=UPI0022FF7443|nr:hypothetical protein [Commensalibacter communis]CAI3959599.1 Dihydrolipoamide dehydrogenase (E3) component of pyruvate/2-oxoglutarate dehydrogenase complex or glutathione oxidoreductase (Lpd) (PDB:6QKG) [Commensalibacter communis]